MSCRKCGGDGVDGFMGPCDCVINGNRRDSTQPAAPTRAKCPLCSAPPDAPDNDVARCSECIRRPAALQATVDNPDAAPSDRSYTLPHAVPDYKTVRVSAAGMSTPQRFTMQAQSAAPARAEAMQTQSTDEFALAMAEQAVVDAARDWHALDTRVNAERLHHYCAELARRGLK